MVRCCGKTRDAIRRDVDNDFRLLAKIQLFEHFLKNCIFLENFRHQGHMPGLFLEH